MSSVTTVTVSLEERSYPIHIGTGILDRAGTFLQPLSLGKKGIIITDDKVGPLHADKLQASLRRENYDCQILQAPAGEESKSFRVMETLCSELAKRKIDRKSFIVALGGGVIGDLAGFVAAAYLRGIQFVQAPTTLLSQVDSSVGGKTGINLPEGKNLVGAFWQPRMVLIDVSTLKTLPQREFRSGLAEVIKHGVIKDAEFFSSLETVMPAIIRLDEQTLQDVVKRNCEIKASVVSADEREETGLRAILNFGHTVGHAIEAAAGYGEYLHGEAISLGMVFALRLSVKRGLLKLHEAERVEHLLGTSGLPLERPSLNIEEIIEITQRDKKTVGGKTSFVLCEGIGKVVKASDVSFDEIKEVWNAWRG